MVIMGLKALHPWESGRRFLLWSSIGPRTLEARDRSPCRKKIITGLGGGSSGGKGMGERLRCQIPLTTSTPCPQPLVLFLAQAQNLLTTGARQSGKKTPTKTKPSSVAMPTKHPGFIYIYIYNEVDGEPPEP